MTDAELKALGEQMWKLHRDETNPELKEIFGLVHSQCVNLRKPLSPIELREMMMASLRDLSRALARIRS